MDKMKFETPNLTAENLKKLSELFPGVVTEGKVNVDLLRSYVGEEIFKDEAYEFTWVGKRAAIAEAGRPIRKTLRPVVEDETTPTGADSTGKPYCSSGSRDWDTTENLYIEGDNLDVLKLLQESYLGKVKMIYIDPPYNTGNDFIYRDDFAKSREDYEEEAGVYDEDGDRLFRNTESNGRFHSDWCSMMYPRLVLARNLLRDDGVIFISIDDGELDSLRKICDEVFGSTNHQATISYVRKTSGKQDSTNFMKSTEFILCYSKSPDWDCAPIIATERVLERYNKADDSGRQFRETDLRKTGNSDRREDRPLMWYPFYFNSETNDLQVRQQVDNSLVERGYTEIFPIKPDGSEGRWRWGFQTSCNNIGNLVARVMPKYKADKKYTVYEIDYIDKKGDVRTVKEHTSWDRKEFNSDNAMMEFKNLGFSNQLFPFPKSSALMKHMLYLANDNEALVLDFFSGSATTAHAVMQLNAEDGGKRKFIMVQLPEVCAEGTEAAKAGYKNICEIGKERIRRAGDKIKEENKDKPGIENLDIGFRVLKLDSTNMNDVYYAAGDYTQDKLSLMESNIKPDRNDMDLLFGCLLDWGLPLSMPHTHEKIDGFTVHTYNDGDLIACFEERISEKAIREIANRQPLRAVFRDSSFSSSPEKINVFEIFKLLAPNTSVKVI
jgi:adenine-specific DNA-methyltransferase